MKRSININTELFKAERNGLNNMWMVHSKHPNLLKCYFFKRKSEALKCVEDLNAQVLKDASEFNFKIEED